MPLVLISLLLLTFAFLVFLGWLFFERNNKINQRIKKRLDKIADTNRVVSVDFKVESTLDNRARILEWAKKYRWVAQLDRKISMSGFEFKLDEFLLVILVTMLLVLSTSLAIGFSVLLSLLFMLCGAYFPVIILNVIVRRRQDVLESQLPDVLDFIARSMQAGHSFSSSMQMAASESPQPIAHEFEIASNRINFGESVHDALAGLAQRIECTDMSYFAVAVLINREVGGDLASLLKNVSQLIRSRLQIKMSIRALTGEARMSAWILGATPFTLAVLLSVLQPKMMSLLFTDPLGKQMLGYALLIMGLGILWMRRLIKIRI